jgi:hypothetical protein
MFGGIGGRGKMTVEIYSFELEELKKYKMAFCALYDALMHAKRPIIVTDPAVSALKDTFVSFILEEASFKLEEDIKNEIFRKATKKMNRLQKMREDIVE